MSIVYTCYENSDRYPVINSKQTFIAQFGSSLIFIVGNIPTRYYVKYKKVKQPMHLRSVGGVLISMSNH